MICDLFHLTASNVYTPRALERCKIPIPASGLVTSNDVSNGKPHPDPYLAGAKRCDIDPSRCE
jgi:beta-phosphoglucomutase-like phosphatase (HAD superfamily)